MSETDGTIMGVRLSGDPAPNGERIAYRGRERVGTWDASGSGYGYSRSRNYRFTGDDGYATSDTRLAGLRHRLNEHYTAHEEQEQA